MFVTATDTGVGKSLLSASLLAAMRAAGVPVLAHKPVLTGTVEPPEGPWPPDDELLALAAGGDAELVTPLRFGPAVSPHLAAELAGEPLDVLAMLARARALDPGPGGAVVVEGVGGLLVPLAEGWLVRDLASELGLPLLIAARPGLGTINHTLLTLAAARSAGLSVRAVVLTPWPESPSEIERSNRETVARLGDVEVCGLAPVARPERRLLAAAGEALPWPAWLGGPNQP